NSGGLIDRFTFGAATEGFSFAKYNDGQSVPGGLSSNSVLGAYESDDPSDDVASPGISSDVPAPLPPFFVMPFQTSVIAGSSLSVSEYRVRSIDPNPGDTISLSLSNAPAWLSLISVSNGVGRFTGTPTNNDIGSHTFQVIAVDNTNREESQTYQIDVLPALTPIILNEYNAVSTEEYLGGGDELEAGAPFDSFFSRIEGNGGAWVEFVVTQNSDIRKWTLEITNKDSTQILKLADHVSLESIPAGTILTFSESNRYLGTSFNQTSRLNIDGYAWTNIWMHDSIVIDQVNSTHPLSSAIGSDDTQFTWKNAADKIIYGPSGENIALSDSNNNGIGDEPIAVGDSEAFRLEANPSASTNPLNINYDDGSSSSYGRPNRWSNDLTVQLFNGFLAVSSPPQITPISTTKAVRGSYSAEASFFDSAHSVTSLAMPDFIEMTIDGATLTLASNRLLTTADIGTYEVAIQIDSGSAANNLSYLVFLLEVLHPSPTVVLNEYNAVEPDRYLNGGTAAADGDGAPASFDSHFGRIVGNGGNWFELAVVGDDTPGTINLTDWTIEVGKIAPSGKFVASTTVVLSDAATWSSVSHGTLLTFIERNSIAGGLDTEINRVNKITTAGYAWTNIHLGTPGFITGTNLDSIPGYQTMPSNQVFRRVVKDCGVAIIGQTASLAPADKRFYATRDITATVESLDLITASILSKKLAAGLEALVMDVKTGSGAFMKDYPDSVALAESIVGVSNGAGLKTSALVTDMNESLAGTAGNALEVLDAVKFLRGESDRSRLETVVMSLSSELLVLGGLAKDRDQARHDLGRALNSGKAAQIFGQMVEGLGGPGDFVDEPEKYLPKAEAIVEVKSPGSGWVAQIETRELGLAVVELGGGRRRAEDEIDHAVGLSELPQLGQQVSEGDCLALVHARSAEEAGLAVAKVQAAVTLSDAVSSGQPVVYEVIEG
ncbi:thymidine phosphorylase, partial [Akkermansiaceae bacterium]|nr:thymidine phosphorylase [Akkermansiaceae bacterium]